MIIKVKPDVQKSKALKCMAEITLERLNHTDMNKYPSNTLLDYYDVVHKLVEALALREGIKVKGEGAHSELIDYIAQKKQINEHMRVFLQQMRDYRNRISYEGFMIGKTYLTSNKDTIQRIIQHLFEQLK